MFLIMVGCTFTSSYHSSLVILRGMTKFVVIIDSTVATYNVCVMIATFSNGEAMILIFFANLQMPKP